MYNLNYLHWIYLGEKEKCEREFLDKIECLKQINLSPSKLQDSFETDFMAVAKLGETTHWLLGAVHTWTEFG